MGLQKHPWKRQSLVLAAEASRTTECPSLSACWWIHSRPSLSQIGPAYGRPRELDNRRLEEEALEVSLGFVSEYAQMTGHEQNVEAT